MADSQARVVVCTEEFTDAVAEGLPAAPDVEFVVQCRRPGCAGRPASLRRARLGLLRRPRCFRRTPPTRRRVRWPRPTRTAGRCGSTPRAPPDCPRRPCTGTPTSATSARPTAHRCWASCRTTRPSPWPSCSSPTASATRCSSRSRSVPPPSSSRDGRAPRWCASGWSATARRCSSAVPTFYAALMASDLPDDTFSRCAGAPVRARRCPRRCSGGSPSGSASRSSTGSGRPRHCTSSCRTGPTTSSRAPRGGRCPGTTSRCATRRARVADRAARCAVRPRRVDRAGLLAPHRGEPPGLPGLVAQHGGHLRARRGRLLPVPGPQQRHAQGGRDLGLPGRGGEPSARAPGRARGSRRRARRRRRARQAGRGGRRRGCDARRS